MIDKSFSLLASEALESLLERMEACQALEDADMDIIDGVLTLVFQDGGQIILNRQEALKQIWLASPLGPAHFNYNQEQQAWLDDKTGEDLVAVLEQALSRKTGAPVAL